ncbi:MAG: response regulator transcription factor [Gemmatimonadetes bacterium]|nr:response regulator transcription factor [Gemmatimonadota bacterium]
MTLPRVLIAEDFEPMADALASWLSPWFEIVGKVSRLEMLAGAIRQTGPDAVLLDLAFKERSALHELPTLRQLPHAPRVVILTAYRDYGLMMGAIDAGASGYVVKTSDFTEVKIALDEVLAGRLYLSPNVRPEGPPRRKIVPRVDDGTWHPTAFEIDLTARQLGILTQLYAGRSARQVATVLEIHHSTVGKELQRLGERIEWAGDTDYLLRWFQAYRRRCDG